MHYIISIRADPVSRAHVAHDILPYSCFIDKCDTPYEMYLTGENLLAHMVDKHSSMRWTCDYCASKDKASKQRSTDAPHEFSSAGEWEDHMGKAHSDRVTAHQRPILAELNKRPMMGPLACPLCDFAMETMDSKIDDHILRHLHEFALWALPESPGAMSDEKSKASQVSGTLSHTKATSGEVEPPFGFKTAKAKCCVASQSEALWIVPFQRNPWFVGRTSEVAQVDAMLSSETRCERVAIVGLGGVGKTQIALEFAYQLRERQPNCSVFWIPVTNVESMLEAYLEISQQMQIPNIEKERADVQKLVQRRLSQECSGRWLLVFDNADDINIWTDKADNTAGSNHRIDYLPKSKHGSILFTTRSRNAATELAGKNVVSVGEIDDTIAKDLPEKYLTDRVLEEQPYRTKATGAGLPMSAPKERLFERLALSEQNPNHRAIYNKMRVCTCR